MSITAGFRVECQYLATSTCRLDLHLLEHNYMLIMASAGLNYSLFTARAKLMFQLFYLNFSQAAEQ